MNLFNMKISLKLIVVFLLLLGWNSILRAEILVYPVPQGIYYARHNDDYTVKVRQAGEKDWVDLFEYNVKVDMDTKSDATMVQFDFSGKVEVLIRKNNGEIRSAIVRPLSKGIQPKIDGNFLLFTLDKPQKLSVEFNGDRLNNLHVFANPIIKDIPDKNDPNVMYFESGIHEPTDAAGKCFRIPSNTTVYLEGGAVLKGCLNCDSVENVKILGYGMLLEPQQGISVAYSKNVLIDGITVVNSRHYTVSGGQSQEITIKNLKSFSYQGWSDGLDFMSLMMCFCVIPMIVLLSILTVGIIMEIAGKYVFRILLFGLILRTPLISVRMAIQRREMKCSKICYSKISISWSMMKTTAIIKDV